MNGSVGQTSALSRKDILIASTLALLVLILGHWRMVPGVCGGYHDDAIYVITAKALAQGQGYRLINLPQPLLQTKYPILYPALLAVIWKVWPAFPDNLLLMKWLSVLCGAAAVGLSYLYLIRFNYFSRGISLAAGLLCATSASYLYFSSQTMSDMPFALLVVLALWGVDARLIEPQWGRTRQFFLGVLLALPFLCRTLGASLVLAGLVVLVHGKRPLRWVVLGAAIIMLPQSLWMLRGLGAWNQDPISGYYADYLSWWSSTDLSSIWWVLWNNFLDIIWANTVLSVEGWHNALRSLDVWGWYEVSHLIGLIPVISAVTQLGRWQLLSFFTMTYLGVVWIWPWPPTRFIIPILPFITGYLFFGIWALLKKYLLLPRCRNLMVAGITVLIVANLTLLYRHHAISQSTGYPFLRLPARPPLWSSYQDLFQWLKVHTRPEDTIACWEDPMVYLYTGRLAFRPFKIKPGPLSDQDFGTMEELVRTLKAYKTRYLVHVPVHLQASQEIYRLLDDVQKRYPGWLKPVYVESDRRFAVSELQPDLAPDTE